MKKKSKLVDISCGVDGPLSFWCLNHELEKPEMARQIAEIKARGYAGFFMHPRAGLLTPYGSEAWFDAIEFCIKEAKKLGLKAWLYDEDPFPSGAAGGRVALEHPEYRASELRFATLEVNRSGSYELDLPAGALVGAYMVEKGDIRRLDACAGTVRTDWRAWFRSIGYYPPYQADSAPHWRADADGLHYRIRVEVERAPATILGLTRHYPAQVPWGAYVDLMNPDAVECFLDLTHRTYQKRFEKHFGKTVPGIFTDEPKLVGRLPWSPAIEEPFRLLTGKILKDCLPHLVLNVDERTPFIRWAYREASSKAFDDAFIKPIAQYCRSVNLAFTGHISPEEDPIQQAYATPNLMQWISAMTVPGVDHIGADIGDVRHPLLHLGPKLVSSAAHTRGKQTVLCEAFAVKDWSQDMAFMGQVVNWLYVLGVNLLCTHGQFYSIDGLRKREAPPSQFLPASYWKHFDSFTRYVSALSSELSVGQHVAPLAIYYSGEAFMAWTQADPTSPPLPESEALRDRLAKIMHRLLTSGYDFDFVDAEAICSAEAVKDHLHIANERYAALLLPGGWMRQDAASSLRRFEKEGVPILSFEKTIPILGGDSFRPRRTTGLAAVVRSVGQFCRPIYRASGELIGHKRQTPDGVRLFLVNNGDTPFCGKVTPDFEGPYEIFDPLTDSLTTALSPLHLEIEPNRGVLIRQGHGAPSVPSHINPSEWKSLLNLSSDWTARPESDNCLVLHEFRMKGTDTPCDINNNVFASSPFMNLLSPDAVRATGELGRVTCFWTSFDCCGVKVPLWLVRDSQLGPPADRACSDSFRFWVNGKLVPAFQRCHRYDSRNLQVRIDGLLEEGRNYLVMEQTLPDDWPLEKGLPYDAVRLFGAFHVEFPHGYTTPARLSSRPPVYKIGTPAGPAAFGHPQYGGLITYKRIVNLDEIPERMAIRFKKLHESAKIYVNGRIAGILWQRPYLLEMDPALWKKGENVLAVECSTSPANFLQALSRPAGFDPLIELCRV